MMSMCVNSKMNLRALGTQQSELCGTQSRAGAGECGVDPTPRGLHAWPLPPSPLHLPAGPSSPQKTGHGLRASFVSAVLCFLLYKF